MKWKKTYSVLQIVGMYHHLPPLPNRLPQQIFRKHGGWPAMAVQCPPPFRADIGRHRNRSIWCHGGPLNIQIINTVYSISSNPFWDFLAAWDTAWKDSSRYVTPVLKMNASICLPSPHKSQIPTVCVRVYRSGWGLGLGDLFGPAIFFGFSRQCVLLRWTSAHLCRNGPKEGCDHRPSEI